MGARIVCYNDSNALNAFKITYGHELTHKDSEFSRGFYTGIDRQFIMWVNEVRADYGAAQNDFYPGYPIIKRGIYYCARMISSQYGTVFTKSHYEKIQKVYSVWICMNPPKERRNTITGYSLTEKQYVGKVKEKEAYYDLMNAIMVCFGKNNEEAESDLLRLLDVLLSSDKKAKEKKDILEREFQIPMTDQIEEEVEHMCNLSDGVEQKGIQKGIEQANRLVIINMLNANEPIEKICHYAQCDEAFVLQIKDELIL